MEQIFSQHVAALVAGSPVDAAILDKVKDVLRSELRRRGIAEYGPSLLGYLGNSWHEGEAIDDLAHDCYIRAIATRLRGLQANLALSGDIEKLVRKNIRTFMGERQARFDPVGHAIFQNIKAAVADLSELGVLKRLEAVTEPVSGTSQFEIVGGQSGKFPDEAALKKALRETGKLVDGLENQCGIGLAAQDALADAIRLLPNQNVWGFGVGTMKRAVSALLDDAAIRPGFAREVAFSDLKTEFQENFRTESRTPGYQDIENYEQLIATIRRAIEGLSRSAKVKARLQTLLTHFAEAISNSDADRQESLDNLAVRFGVPRSTLHDDFQSLRSLVTSLVKSKLEN